MSKNDRFSPEQLPAVLEKAMHEGRLEKNDENLRLVFSMIDLTSLGSEDSDEKIRGICRKVKDLPGRFPGLENVGAVCVWPSLVHLAKQELGTTTVGIASVAAAFPSSQTFLPVKEMESKLAVDAGATEIDIVIPLGKFLGSDPDAVNLEVSRIKEIISPAKLKVILETGLLPGPLEIYDASMRSLEAGADFIKTSTGKIQPAASPEAVLVMCQALKDFFEKSGRMAGIKPAGAISTTSQALEYASIVNGVLGSDWLNPKLFRIGASRLANNVLEEITGESSYF